MSFTTAQLAPNVAIERDSITATASFANPVGTISDSHSFLFFATSSCMDLRGHGRETSSRHVRQQQSRSSLVQASASGAGRQAQTTPLPQTQWSSIPLPYRPKNYVEPADQPPLPRTDTAQDWRLRPSIPGNALSSSAVPAPLRTRRRPRGVRDITDLPSQQRPDAALLYPEMNPYSNRLSSYSAPDELQHFTRSAPSSPPYFQQSFAEAEPPSIGIPRSPTYPPAGRRRMHSASGVTDAAFADEEEFRLFVNATAGLGPEQTVRHARLTLDPPQHRTSLGPNSNANRPSSTEQITSPVESTPTTLQALQHLASMPQASEEHPPHQLPRQSRPQTSRQRLQTLTSGLDLWLQPPSATQTPDRGVSPLEEDLESPLPPDEELPDYASSQAQAQAAQRVEATRRAQELQRRWQASGGRVGPDALR